MPFTYSHIVVIVWNDVSWVWIIIVDSKSGTSLYIHVLLVKTEELAWKELAGIIFNLWMKILTNRLKHCIKQQFLMAMQVILSLEIMSSYVFSFYRPSVNYGIYHWLVYVFNFPCSKILYY